MKLRCSFCTLWLPTLLTSIITVLSFLVMYFFLHFNINAMVKAHEHSAELTKNIEKMVSSTLNAIFLGNEEAFLITVTLSNQIHDEIITLKDSTEYDTSSLLESYTQLYKMLIGAVSYSKENRFEDAKNALEDVNAYATKLAKQTEELNRYFVKQEEDGEKTFIGLIIILAFTLLAISLFNGFYLIPHRVIRPLEEFSQTIQKNEEKYRIVADWTYDWEYWLGIKEDIIFMSPSVQRITGYTPQDFIQKPSLLSQIIHPDDKDTWMQHIKAAHLPNRAEDDAQEVEFRIITKESKVVYIGHICRPVYSDEGIYMGVRVANRDITAKMNILAELKEKNMLLDRLSSIDGLSCLYNRRYFDEALTKEVQRAKRFHTHLSLIMCDIDYFKLYNDTYGHQQGDVAIQKVSNILKETFSRSIDTVARYGGEEFVIILPSTSTKDAQKLAQKAKEAIEKLQIQHKNSNVAPYITMSFGVSSCINYDIISMDNLLKKADDALYKSKEDGRNRVSVFEC